jgi:hypothetical protein
MIKGKKIIKLSIELILSKISEYDIFNFYMPHKWKLNIPTFSPFRHEKNESFLIGNKNGKIIFIDFADTSKKGGCFDFVMMLYNINLQECLKKIDRDFNLGFSSGVHTNEYKKIIEAYKQPIIEEKKYSTIQCITRKFTKEELAYWNEYSIDIEELKKNNVYSIKKVYLNRQLFSLDENQLRFGYYYDGHWKIYSPFEERKKKWMPNNVPITAMDGKQNIINCNVALITKSRKDFMVLSKVFPCVCAMQNEGIACFSKENISFLKENSKKQILVWDSDIPGVKNSQQITKIFDFGYCNVPKKYLSMGCTDFADIAKEYGILEVEKILKNKKLI